MIPFIFLEFPDKNRTKDTQIIKRAIAKNRVVISKDSDFLDSFLLSALPPKLIMVKTGNIPNKKLIQIFGENLKIIVEMISRSNLVEINQTDIAEQS